MVMSTKCILPQIIIGLDMRVLYSVSVHVFSALMIFENEYQNVQHYKGSKINTI
jgi:hypothetical protein